jgi:DNA-binding transcriptional MerR regulator
MINWHRADLNQLFANYQVEGITMPYTMEDFRRDYTRDHLELLTAEEILQRLPTEKIKAYLAQLEQQSDRDKKDKD